MVDDKNHQIHPVSFFKTTWDEKMPSALVIYEENSNFAEILTVVISQ